MKSLVPDQPVLGRVDELLLEREGRVLQWSLAARLAFLCIVGILLVAQLLRLAPAGVMAQNDEDAKISLAVMLLTAAIVGSLLAMARRGRNIRLIGLGVIFVDLAVLAVMPWIWLNTVPELERFPPGLAKGDLFAATMLMVIINSITLRPLYPALMAGGSVVLLAGLAAVTLSGPEVATTDSYVEHFTTPAVNVGLIATRCIFLSLAGTFLTAMAYTSRRTIRETISLELAHLDLKERQAELAMEGRMTSIKGLVAGLAHELNTPLGVLSSSLGTIESGVEKLLADNVDDSRSTRARHAIAESAVTAQKGLDRIGAVVESLKDFSRLDESEVQQADLRQEIDTVLSLIDRQIVGRTEIIRKYQEITPIECRPRELNQAFLTILVNGFEAVHGEGRLEIGVERDGEEVRVSVSDSGPGIPAERMPTLFDVTFSRKGERVAMRMGLPTARMIVERHGGRIQVDSQPGRGATFVVTLPA